VANYPTSLPSSSPSTHGVVKDEIIAIATTLGITGGPNYRGLLATQVHNPGSEQSVSSSSATYADVDATNWAVTFTAPASGAVLVRASFGCLAGAASPLFVNLRESTTNLTNSGQRILFSGGADTGQGRGVYTHRVTGLTASSSYTYKIGFSRQSGSNTVEMKAGGGDAAWGAMVIEVWAA
jgi:hypothetical protein